MTLNPSVTKNVKTMKVTSDAFNQGLFVPRQYTCDGDNVNPALTIHGIPKETKSLALIAEDPDALVKTWTHWIVWNIPPLETIKENSIPGIEGINDFGYHHYGGPCPPSGTHRYFFKVYALDTILELNKNAKKRELEKAIEPHIIGFGEIAGLYKKV